jgi:hypothetical protein
MAQMVMNRRNLLRKPKFGSSLRSDAATSPRRKSTRKLGSGGVTSHAAVNITQDRSSESNGAGYLLTKFQSLTSSFAVSSTDWLIAAAALGPLKPILKRVLSHTGAKILVPVFSIVTTVCTFRQY